jgi:hypothetical protein
MPVIVSATPARLPGSLGDFPMEFLDEEGDSRGQDDSRGDQPLANRGLETQKQGQMRRRREKRDENQGKNGGF